MSKNKTPEELKLERDKYYARVAAESKRYNDYMQELANGISNTVGAQYAKLKRGTLARREIKDVSGERIDNKVNLIEQKEM